MTCAHVYDLCHGFVDNASERVLEVDEQRHAKHNSVQWDDLQRTMQEMEGSFQEGNGSADLKREESAARELSWDEGDSAVKEVQQLLTLLQARTKLEHGFRCSWMSGIGENGEGLANLLPLLDLKLNKLQTELTLRKEKIAEVCKSHNLSPALFNIDTRTEMPHMRNMMNVLTRLQATAVETPAKAAEDTGPDVKKGVRWAEEEEPDAKKRADEAPANPVDLENAVSMKGSFRHHLFGSLAGYPSVCPVVTDARGVLKAFC
eukprot:gene17579-20931_t